jgi:hypothetical protein
MKAGRYMKSKIKAGWLHEEQEEDQLLHKEQDEGSQVT